MDVSNDILLNINDESLKTRQIPIVRLTDPVIKPVGWELKAFRKILSRIFDKDNNIKSLFVGFYLEPEEPYFVIGIRVGINFHQYPEVITKALRKKFSRVVKFEYIELRNVENEYIAKHLLVGGEKIGKR